MSDTPRSIVAQRKAVPLHVEAAVMRALEKLPADRFAQAAALATALEASTSGTLLSVAPRAKRTTRGRMLAGVFVMTIATATAFGGWRFGQRSLSTSGDDRPVMAELSMGGTFRSIGVELTSNGRVVGIVGGDSTGAGIRLRDLSSDSSYVIPGSQGVNRFAFSPDGESLVFLSSDGSYRRMAVAGGPSTQIASPKSFNTSFHWGADDWVYFTQISGALSRVRASGGVPESLTALDSTRREFSHWDPQLLPGGKALLFFSYAFPADSSRVEVVDISTRRRQTLVSNASFPRYAAEGYLTFIRDGIVMAVRFDAAELRVTGEPVTILTNVASDLSLGASGYAISKDGTLVYQRQSDIDAPQLVREIGRDGRDGEVLTTTGRWAEPRLSPDGRYLALSKLGRIIQIWLLDRARGVFSQLTHGAGASFSPNWAPDSRSLIHIAETPVYDVVRTPLDGSAVDTLQRSPADKVPTGVGPDGRSWTFMTGGQVFVGGGTEAPRPLSANGSSRVHPVISPDGNWIAYTERVSATTSEVYVQSLTGPARRQVSSRGGAQPRWTKGGRELIYRRRDAVLAAPFDPATGEPGISTELFRRPMAGSLYNNSTIGFDVSPDGQRFFLVIPQENARGSTVALVLNWRRELERALAR